MQQSRQCFTDANSVQNGRRSGTFHKRVLYGAITHEFGDAEAFENQLL